MKRIPILIERQAISEHVCALSEDERIGYVYLIVNKLNNMPYVGIKFSNTFIESYWGSSDHLNRFIKKHGTQFLTRSILEWCSTKELLLAKEQYWIKFFNSYLGYGYNHSEGGGGGNTWIGHSEEEKEEISKKLSSNMRKNSKKVIQLTLQLEFIKEYECMEDTRKFGFNPASVCNCLHKKNKSYKQFIWMYSDEYQQSLKTGVFPDFSHKSRRGENNPMYGIHRCGENAPFYNRHHSEDSKEKNRQSHLGKLTGENNPNYGGKYTKCGKDNPNYKHGKYCSQKEKVDDLNKVIM